MGSLAEGSPVLAVCAHPDDESFGLGAALAAFAVRRTPTAVLCLTHGAASSLGTRHGDLHQIRAAELAARCRQAGATVAGPDAGTGPGVIEITGMDSAEVGRLAAAHGIALSELIPVKASLEEAFMELTRGSVEYQAAGGPR